MDKITFSCIVQNESDVNDLGLEVWMDNEKFFDSNIESGQVHISHEFIEDECEHSLRFVFKNKTIDHTTIDEDGTITSDAVLQITNLTLDNMEIDQIFYKEAVYTHNRNGALKQHVQEKFYGTLGCNGTVSFDFYTPFYMWLLENM